MKRLLTFGYSLLALVTFAQQNLFNIPSGDLTPKNKIFFQQQINFYKPWEFESKSHFVYGITKWADIGLNVINIPFNLRSGNITQINDNRNSLPLFPVTMFSAQVKIIELKKFRFHLGTQMGMNLSRNTQNKRLLYLHYGLSVWELWKKLKVIAGPYIVNHFLAGRYAIGGMAGFELPVSKKFILMGDYVSGTHAQAATVLGATYCISQRVQVCFGYLMPYLHHRNYHGIVFELNLLGYNPETPHYE